MGPEGVLGHDQPEDGVAQVLEALVGVATPVLRAPRPVGEGLAEELGMGELVPDTVRQLLV